MAKQGAGKPNPLANDNWGLLILGAVVLAAVLVVCICG